MKRQLEKIKVDLLNLKHKMRGKSVVMHKLKALLIVIITSTILWTQMSEFVLGYSNYTTLGTNKALGSPVLNENFEADDWNKWEMICWGVYLSNFCVPLVDTYQTAFNTGAGGSDGSGYKALSFGSGSDSRNNETIQSLCSYAISQQASTTKTMYVTFSKIEDGVLTKVDANDEGAVVRPARFVDLWMSNTSWANDDYLKQVYNEDGAALSVYSTDYKGLAVGSHSLNVTYIKDGTIPTFWIRQSGSNKYIKVFDYTDSWDVQIASAIVSRVSASDMTSEFYEAFNNYYGPGVVEKLMSFSSDLANAVINSSTYIKMDTFGNIVTNDNKMIIPASANQHLTTTDSINLLTSFVMNGQSDAVSDDKLNMYARQYIDEFGGLSEDEGMHLGLPALSGKNTKLKNGVAYLYYDLGSIIMNRVDYAKASTTGTQLYNTYGEDLITLFNCGLNNKSNGTNLKLEVVNKTTNTGLFLWQDVESGTDNSVGSVLSEQLLASSILSSQIGTINTSNVTDEIVLPNGETQELFNKTAVCIPVAIKTDNDEKAQANSIRKMWNFLYKSYSSDTNTTSGVLSSSDIKKLIQKSSTIYDLANALDSELTVAGSTVTDIFKTMYSTVGNGFSTYKDMDYADNESFGAGSSRVILLYNITDTMRKVGNVLGVRAGTEFALYSTYLYATYLDWYGILDMDKLGISSGTSNFNTSIYDGNSDVLNVTITDLIETKTEKQIEEETKYYSYLMLSPSLGREYRMEVATNAVMDFITEQYNRIVYGKASDYYGTTSSADSGFLNIDTYSDNVLTGFIVNNYAAIAIILIAVMLVLIIVHGLLSKRKLSWFLISAVLMVNGILLLPSTGEIVSLVSQNMVQAMFSDKMVYWSIAEGISNSSIENQTITSGSSDSNLTYLIKSLSSLYTDRSLMLKRDISAKTVQNVEGIYTDIQQLKSARWLLPTILRQYTATNAEDAESYVYIPMSDLFDDESNLYWYYNPQDADDTNTIFATATSGQNNIEGAVYDSTDKFVDSVYNRSLYNDFVDLTSYDDAYSMEFQSSAYKVNEGEKTKLQHTYNYILDNAFVRGVSLFSNYITMEDMYAAYASSYESDLASKENWINIEKGIESVADKYDRSDRSTMNQQYGYLWATESIAHIMYGNVKESLSSDTSLGSIIGQLQGKYSKDADGNEKRDSFMHAKLYTDVSEGSYYATGYVKDICDLQNIFTNVVPYLYSVMMITGGVDGEHGVLEGRQVEDYSIYKGTDQSWLFRSNWVVKIVENEDYNKPMEVSRADGTKYTIQNPLMPSSYPTERPMVFSEAQKQAYGLKDSDLNKIELMCIQINNTVCKDWTLLINYAGTDGLTREVLVREMALIATMQFNKTFSPEISSSAYKLYPQSVDLRNISFDSIMKMLMMNTSKDASYIYGSTMDTLITNSDTVTAILLLVVAYMCSYIVPFVRMILMAEIFYLGFIALFRSLLSDVKYKMSVAGGQIFSNLIFTVVTALYYLVFVLLTSLTSTDEVLSVNYIKGSTGSPVGSLMIVLIASIAYIIAMIWQINFCFKHARDMGAEVYKMAISNVTNKFSDVTNKFVAGDSASGESKSTYSGEGDTVEASNVNINDEKDKSSSSDKDDIDYDETATSSDNDLIDASAIDEAIEEGKEADK